MGGGAFLVVSLVEGLVVGLVVLEVCVAEDRPAPRPVISVDLNMASFQSIKFRLINFATRL